MYIHYCTFLKLNYFYELWANAASLLYAGFHLTPGSSAWSQENHLVSGYYSGEAKCQSSALWILTHCRLLYYSPKTESYRSGDANIHIQERTRKQGCLWGMEAQDDGFSLHFCKYSVLKCTIGISAKWWHITYRYIVYLYVSIVYIDIYWASFQLLPVWALWHQQTRHNGGMKK